MTAREDRIVFWALAAMLLGLMVVFLTGCSKASSAPPVLSQPVLDGNWKAAITLDVPEECRVRPQAAPTVPTAPDGSATGAQSAEAYRLLKNAYVYETARYRRCQKWSKLRR